MKLLYFTFIENPFAPENQGVMRGQVINLLKTIATENNDIEVHWLALINTKFFKPACSQIANLKKELKESKVELNLIELPESTLKRNTYAMKILSDTIQKLKPDIVHCRVYPSTLIALKTRKKDKLDYKIIFDARGVYPEQILERSSGIVGKLRYHYWKHLEKQMLKESDLTTGVTTTFVSHFKKIHPSANLKYIPCCVKLDNDIPRNEILELRKNLEFSNSEIIAVYSGNLSAKYSSVNYIAEIFSNLYNNENKFRFLILTKSNTEKLESLLKDKNLLDKTNILNLKPQEVPIYLSICNIGVLFREKSIVNEVAMPTKFAEYLSCGLPVIVSESIKGVAEIVKEKELGIVQDNSDITPENVKKLLSINSEKCREVSKLFSIQAVARQYYDEYLKLLNNTI